MPEPDPQLHEEGDRKTDRYRKVPPPEGGGGPASDTPLATLEEEEGESSSIHSTTPLDTGPARDPEEDRAGEDEAEDEAGQRPTARYAKLTGEVEASRTPGATPATGGWRNTDGTPLDEGQGATPDAAADQTPLEGETPTASEGDRPVRYGGRRPPTDRLSLTPTPPGLEAGSAGLSRTPITPLGMRRTTRYSPAEIRARQRAQGRTPPASQGGEPTPAGTEPTPVDSQESHGDTTALRGGEGTRRGTSRDREDPLLKRLIGGVVLEERIGKGGMGMIYRARHPHLRREFAIKILPPRLAQLPPFVERFINEGRASGRINHPNVVHVHCAGKEEGFNFIIMELASGKDLRRRIDERGAMHENDVLHIALEVTSALVSAHSVGIIHRDIKPENILLEEDTGRVRVTDFGLSMDTSADLAAVEASIGTPNYMSPEQCTGRGCDERSDIYALGATCYYLLTRRPPYSGHTAAAVMIQHIVEPPPDPRIYAPRTRDEFAEVVMRMMSKDPAQRYGSALELREELERVRQGEPLSPRPEGLPRPQRGDALLTQIIQGLVESRGDDIHLHVDGESTEVLYRIDGELTPQRRLSGAEGDVLVEAVRRAAGLEDTPAPVPRQGKIDVTLGGGRRRSLFVGLLPGVASLRVTLRLLPAREFYPLSHEKLGLTGEQQATFEAWLGRRQGVILATGPAGSGRTHFLYACIEQVRREPLSVITLEEQPELSFSGVTQIVYAPDRGLDAASAFQAAMEQDTDVAMVAGVEGARWPDLYRAAQAGRLILAEGSQPDPIAMLRRLHECGVPAEQLRDLTLGIVTGRVVPRACGECLKPTSPRPEHLEALGIPEERAPEAVPLPAGCESCKGRGTVGLLCVRTFLVPDRELLEALAAGQSSAALRELAASRGLAVPLHGLFREQVQAGRVRIHDAIAALSDVH